jgi:PAS domain S-box-containing protein
VSEEQLSGIMKSMGKYELADELNCGVCGYNTCKEKAKAVAQGMAETDMCLNYMRNKAERITNVIFENSPSIIFLIDEEMNIVELNPTAEINFSTKAEFIKGKPISILIDDSDFIKVKETKVSILGKKVAYPKYNSIFIQNVLYLEKQNVILITMSDISEIESNKKELMRVRENTLNAAQQVIEKQMRVAQEIASLLGETTAETKITLTKLKKIVLGEDGGL